jgi:hypothetical protein
MKHLFAGISAVVLSCLCFCGCGRNDADDSDVGEEPVSAVEVSRADLLRAELDALKLKDGRAAVIARMNALLKDAEAAEVKAYVTNWLLDEYLVEDALSDVQDLYLTLAAGDSEVARMGFRKISSASYSTNTADTVVWYEKILSAPVEDELKAFIWRSRVSLYRDAGSVAPAVARLDEFMGFESAGLSQSVCQSLADAALGLKDYASIDTLIKAIRGSHADDETWQQLALMVEADALLDKGQLVELDALLAAQAALLGDAALSGRSETLLVAAVTQGADAIVARVVESALAGGAEFPRTLSRVALKWVQLAVSAKDSTAFLERTEQVLKTELPVSRLSSVITSGYYMAMQENDAALQKRASTLVASIAAKDGLPDPARQGLELMLLDDAFYASDFKRAMSLLEKGITGHDEDWHTELKDKVGAHLALEEGRHEDAIKLFRTHMARVEAWEQPVINPEDQTKMIKEAVLGFNEKRIGDIYSEMGSRSKDAKEAYARARVWYQMALSELEPDSAEHATATAELALVPAAPEAPDTK